MTSPASAAVDADAIAAAVLTAPAVAGLHTGGVTQIATYLPGRRVEGVRVGEDRVQVAVVAVHGVPLIAVAEQVRERVVPLAGGLPVDVHVGDVQLPQEEQLALPPADADQHG